MTLQLFRLMSPRQLLVVMALVLVGLTTACSDDDADPATVQVPTPVPEPAPTATPSDSDVFTTTVLLSPANEVPPVVVPSNATGSATVVIDTFTQILTVTGSFTDLSSPLLPIGNVGPGHLHLSITEPGQVPSEATGPVLYPLTLTVDAASPLNGTFSGSFLLPQDIVASAEDLPDGFDPTIDPLFALLNGEIYFNIHTESNPSGELRGQITFF